MLDIGSGVHLADPQILLWLVLIYLFAALLSGLSGFGFSGIGALTLIYLPPEFAISLLMMLSVVTQAGSLSRLWREMKGYSQPWNRPDGVIPYFVGGAIGMPVGIHIMLAAGASGLIFAFAMLLVSYSIYGLLIQAKPIFRNATGWRSAILVGACGGVIGGFTAFPGSALVIWNSLNGVSKEHARALIQPFILFMQLVGLALIAGTHPQLFDPSFWKLFVTITPVVLVGSIAGVAIYKRTSQINYRRITMGALGLSGAGLLLKLGLV